MEFKQFASKWLSLHKDNLFLKVVCASLIGLVYLVVTGWLKKDEVVILVPPGLSEKSEISRNKATAGYKKAWAMHTAMLIGNVTPENADFVTESFSNMVSGEIRTIVTEQITQELDNLKLEKVSSTFEVTRVTYEPETDKVFVTGRNRMTGVGGKSTPTEQTFEFIIDVKQYSPIITHMASYEGMPKILSVIQKEEAKHKAEVERQKLTKQ